MKRISVGLIVLSLIIACGQAFSQTAASPQKLGVTDGDVKAVATNFDKIQEDFDKYDLDFITADPADYEKVANDLENILKKYGISGPNRLQKTASILSGAAYEETAAQIEREMDAATLAYMKSMGIDPYAAIQQLKQNIHPDDMKVISRNSHLFRNLFDDD